MGIDDVIFPTEYLSATHFEQARGRKSYAFWLVGNSGSGKSTLLHILGTLDKPDKGEIFFNGINIVEFSEKKLSKFRNQNIGFVFQFHHLLPEFTALENVAMPRLINGEAYFESMKTAENLLSEMNLLERKNHYPNQLSGGEQQRVAVARALINNPEIILADEPTGNLDKNHSEQLIQILWQLNERFETSLLIVTHNENLAQKAEIVYKLENGNLTRSE